MIWSVIVGAAGDRYRQAESAVVGQHQQVSARLGRRVGAGGVNGRFLGEEQVGTVQRQVAVNLIGRYLMIAPDTVFTAGVHENLRTQNVGAQKNAGVLDGAVHVAFGGEVDDDVRLFLLEQLVYSLTVADVGLDETEVRIIHHGGEGGEIARVGQLVQTHDAVIGIVLQLIKDEVGADESGATGHDNSHGEDLLTASDLSVDEVAVAA